MIESSWGRSESEPVWKPITPTETTVTPVSATAVTEAIITPVGPLPPAQAEVIPSYDQLLERLRNTESRIQELERVTGTDSPDDGQLTGWRKHLNVPEPDTAQAIQESIEKAAGKKEKKWYEKLSIRGYTQVRLNEVVRERERGASANFFGDSSVGDSRNFLIRRARLVISGDVSDNVFVYLQPDFAASVPGVVDSHNYPQLRDWYADVFYDKTKVHRLRIGQSKVPYGWENMQSSSNRLALDRNDALNSAVRNERDMGVFYYWTPEYAQDLYRYVLEEKLKGSGNYGVFALGAYNGQGGSFLEQNNNLHIVSRLNIPYRFDNGQIMEFGLQAFTGRYTVFSSLIRPRGEGPSTRPSGTFEAGNIQGIWEERAAASIILYPQPIGFQAEWQIGHGPALADNDRAVVRRPLTGGYVQAHAKLPSDHGVWWPYIRWQYFQGGYRSERNAPYGTLNETELGVEWQIQPAMELTVAYTFANRSSLRAIDRSDEESYRQFVGEVLRMQFQFNY